MLSILSWNIRQGGGSRVAPIISALLGENPSIIVLSEFRNNPQGILLRTALLKRGYNFQVCSAAAPNVNSVLMASKFPCGSTIFPTSDPEFPNSVIRIELPAFHLYGVYLPHKKKHKLFEFMMEQFKENPAAIVVGDYNTGKNGIDQKGKSFWYTDQLRAMEKMGYEDAFRLKNGQLEEYSWFSHQGNGYRYDHSYVHESLSPIVRECYYIHTWREEGMSDHSPMMLILG